MLTIAGVGPGDPGARTLALQEALGSVDQIILRTAIHPGVEDIQGLPNCVTCDDLYESEASFETVYRAITDRVIMAAAKGNLLYLVPGSPVFGELTVPMVLERAEALGIETRVLPSVSALETISIALGVDLATEQVQIADGYELSTMADSGPFSGGMMDFSPAYPVLVLQVHNDLILSGVQLMLMDIFPSDHSVALVRETAVEWAALEGVDELSVDHLSSLWVPGLLRLDATAHPATLATLLALLRDEDGCPWDREQDQQSLRKSLLAEAYEVIDAIDFGDPWDRAEEFGDLLLVVGMLMQIADETEGIGAEQVYDQVNRKIIRRHPHVFGDEQAKSAGAVVETWERIKSDERKVSGKETPVNPFDKLPSAMPAMTKAAKLAKLEPKTDELAPEALQTGEQMADLVDQLIASGYDPDSVLDAILARRHGTSSRRFMSKEEKK